MRIRQEGEFHPYIGATRLAADLWEYMLNDDDACRDITDRDAHATREIGQAYPAVHPGDIGYISLLGSATAEDRIALKPFSS